MQDLKKYIGIAVVLIVIIFIANSLGLFSGMNFAFVAGSPLSVLSLYNVDYSAGGTHFNHEWRSLVMIGSGATTGLTTSGGSGTISIPSASNNLVGNDLTMADGTTHSRAVDLSYQIRNEACSYSLGSTAWTGISEWQIANPPSAIVIPNALGQATTIPTGTCIPDSRFNYINLGDLTGRRTEFQTACHAFSPTYAKVVSCRIMMSGVAVPGDKCVIATPVSGTSHNIKIAGSSFQRTFNVQFNATNVNGSASTTTITNSVTTGSAGNTFVEWTSMGFRGTDCPTPEVAAVWKGTATRIIPKSTAIAISGLSPYNAIYGTSFAEWTTSDTAVSNNAQTFSSTIRTLDTVQTPTDFASGATITSSAITKDYTNAPVFYPIMTMYINADWVGLIEPQPTPVFTQWDNPTLTVGATRTATYRARNDGDTAPMYFSLLCTNNIATFLPYSPSNSVLINHNSIDTRTTPIHCLSVGTQTCTASFSGSRDANKVSKPITITCNAAVVQPTWCNAPTYTWDGSQCTFVSCPVGQTLNPTTHYCEPQGGGGGCGFTLPTNSHWTSQQICEWSCNANYTYVNSQCTANDSGSGGGLDWTVIIIIGVVVLVGIVAVGFTGKHK